MNQRYTLGITYTVTDPNGDVRTGEYIGREAGAGVEFDVFKTGDRVPGQPGFVHVFLLVDTSNLITAVNNPAVYLERVDIKLVKATRDTPAYYLVSPIWHGVDRPDVGGTGCVTMAMASRLRRAIEAGAALGPAEVKVDVDGKTYVEAPHRFLAKRLNSSLRKLGF